MVWQRFEMLRFTQNDIIMLLVRPELMTNHQ